MFVSVVCAMCANHTIRLTDIHENSLMDISVLVNYRYNKNHAIYSMVL